MPLIHEVDVRTQRLETAAQINALDLKHHLVMATACAAFMSLKWLYVMLSTALLTTQPGVPRNQLIQARRQKHWLVHLLRSEGNFAILSLGPHTLSSAAFRAKHDPECEEGLPFWDSPVQTVLII